MRRCNAGAPFMRRTAKKNETPNLVPRRESWLAAPGAFPRLGPAAQTSGIGDSSHTALFRAHVCELCAKQHKLRRIRDVHASLPD